MRAFVFPGQGSQKIGMGRDLADAFSVSKAVFEEIDDALGQHLSKLMWEGDEEELRLTENTQPALMAVSMAVIRALESDGRALTDIAGFVAGHSLGEYSALCAAGSFGIATAAKLLKLRGQAMQRAVPVGEGAMAAIIGLSADSLADVLNDASDAGIVVSANDNSEGQIVISGAKNAVEKASELAKAAGAKRAMPLPVSAPFHSPLMKPAADEMADALVDIDVKDPNLPLIANVTAAKVTSGDEIKALLVEQVTASVRWRESVAGFAGLGIAAQIEAGAGKVLTGLARRINRDLDAKSLETAADIEAFSASL